MEAIFFENPVSVPVCHGVAKLDGMPGTDIVAAHGEAGSVAARFEGRSPMENATFKQPVFVRDDGYGIQKIGCAMDAIEFLEEWPVERRGLLHAAASDACYSAYDGRKSVEAAHKAFATWAHRVGVIEAVPAAPPWMTGPKIQGDYLLESDG
ncbi:DUF982 domain-containing protein [Mesorhizobium sp. M1396]|uniref:DUF982 domain-containing protein n=1 Tax=Mesorhizobium sp. M1396 TaxID=2957095 RepID=UPI00333C145C